MASLGQDSPDSMLRPSFLGTWEQFPIFDNAHVAAHFTSSPVNPWHRLATRRSPSCRLSEDGQSDRTRQHAGTDRTFPGDDVLSWQTLITNGDTTHNDCIHETSTKSDSTRVYQAHNRYIALQQISPAREPPKSRTPSRVLTPFEGHTFTGKAVCSPVLEYACSHTDSRPASSDFDSISRIANSPYMYIPQTPPKRRVAKAPEKRRMSSPMTPPATPKKRCQVCFTAKTPLWRKAPNGWHCNRCGLRIARGKVGHSIHS